MCCPIRRTDLASSRAAFAADASISDRSSLSSETLGHYTHALWAFGQGLWFLVIDLQFKKPEMTLVEGAVS